MNNPLFRQLSPSVQLIILFMLYFLCLSIGAFAAVGIGSAWLHIPVNDVQQVLQKASPEQANTVKVMQAAALIFAFFLPPVFYVLIFGKKNVNSFLLRNSGWIMLIGPLYIISASAWIDLSSKLNHWLIPEGSWLESMFKSTEDSAMEMTTSMLQYTNPADFVLSFICIAALPAICEELFFRGTLQPLLAKVTKNVHVAIWTTAILFSAFHFQFYGFLPRLLLGGLLGYLTIWTGSLYTPILAHLFNNALALIVFTKYGSLDGPTEGQATDWTIYAVSFFLFGITTWYINQRSVWPALQAEYLGNDEATQEEVEGQEVLN